MEANASRGTVIMAAPSSYFRFVQALNILNAALEARRDMPAWRNFLNDCERELSGVNLGVAVYDADPEQPYDFYTIRLNQGVFVIVSRGVNTDEIAWRVSRSALEDLVSRPGVYIDDPSRLDLSWLRRRLRRRPQEARGPALAKSSWQSAG
jgi:hypothetical protein